MKELKLEAFLFDKHTVIPLKVKYDPETRIATSKRGFREKTSLKFLVDPDHIYRVRKGGKDKLVVFVDNAKRTSITISNVNPNGSKITEQVNCVESVKMHSNEDLDLHTATSLDVLTERSFWKALMEKHKIPLSTIIIMLLAGAGLYHIIVLILRAMGLNV